MSFRRNGQALTIGVDFDNTIVDYDNLMHSIAVDWGVLGRDTAKDKKIIRDTIRSSRDGETVWQRLQIAAYGLRMTDAVPTAGVKEFFRLCKERSIPLCIVSHKTTFPNLQESTVNLREEALRWLEQEGFLSEDGFGIGTDSVYFESTRREKIARIGALGVTHFIDDLEETFEDPTFPGDVKKILYAPGIHKTIEGARMFRSWAGICTHLFAGAA